MSDTSITIYHNPQCGTSRNVLAMIRNSGAEPTVIEYLKTPLKAEQLQVLVQQLGMPVRDLLRQKGTPYEELGLGAAHWTDAQLIDQIEAHPILMNRPVVVTAKGAKLCRPSEAVLDLLPNELQGGFTKEDGEVVEPGKASNV
ncbi:arsenate reductase (glutaredoxin) [Hydrogenophaga sp. PAMC20947]|uniref:arsenate reductase (glutaredoxin) n=1 Tax=Hydrogenophaga sp. PAMC20947 TaxID=2565558 RepID=UPI00109E013B|nr:arsenate reductase (glutaredoxin) [Hydrogenophaga sp. PAMC20947]QCB46786.1 arsenate reductase (glutaredoxin) [Hydrogenophaga sp. PAMC20947]